MEQLKRILLATLIPALGRVCIHENKFINVIYYHDIVQGEGRGVAKENIETFMEQMTVLKQSGYKTYTFDDLEKNPELNMYSPDSVLIVFDDGWKSNYTEIFAFMKENNIKYNVFLIAGRIGRNEKYMTWDMVREMHSSGIVGFGAHTMNHVVVDDLSKVSCSEEFRQADELIFEKTGVRVRDFCYPFGNYSDKTTDYLANTHGYKRIYTSDRMYSYSVGNSTVFGRTGIDDKDSLYIFKCKTSGLYNIMGTIKKSANKYND